MNEKRLRHYERRKAAGRCVICGAPAEKRPYYIAITECGRGFAQGIHKVLCPYHADKQRARASENRRKHREAKCKS